MSRKYRQRGYQDDGGRDRGGERTESRPIAPRTDRLRPDRPGGRGLGAPGREAFRCADCGAEQAPPAPEATGAACVTCSAPLHTCTNCRNFDRSARFQCSQPIEEPVRGKAKANECGHFTAKIVLAHEREEAADPSDPRSAFDALFDNL